MRLLREDPGDLPLIIHMGDVGAFPSTEIYGEDCASVAARLVATLADVLVLAVVNGLVVGITVRIFGLPMTLANVTSIQTWPMAAFYLALALLYVAGLTWQAGQTLGKRLAGIRVVDEADDAVSVARALVRAVGWLAALATLGLLAVPALFDRRRRTVADRLAGTHVVNV